MTAENLPLLLALAAAGAVGAMVVAISSPRLRLAVLAFVAVPQFFIVPGLDSLPLSRFVAIVMGVALVGVDRRVLRHPMGKALLGVLGVNLVAVLWAPDRTAWALGCVRIYAFIVVLMYACHLMRMPARDVKFVMRWFTPWLILQSGLVVAFRLRPALERLWLESSLAGHFGGLETREKLFTVSPDNVFDDAKSGGLYFNANTASLFLGVSAMVYLMLARRYGIGSYRVVALIAYAGVFFTGSKSGIALAIGAALVAFTARALVGSKAGLLLIPIALTAPFAVQVVQRFLEERAGTYAAESEDSLETRLLIWDAASELFSAHPVLGLGWGGWGQRFPSLAYERGIPTRLPEHNFIIQQWSNAGIVSAILVLVFAVVALATIVRSMQDADKNRQLEMAAALGALLWLLGHGLGDTTTFYGDARTMLPIALALAAALSPVVKLQEEDSVSTTRQLQGRSFR